MNRIFLMLVTSIYLVGCAVGGISNKWGTFKTTEYVSNGFTIKPVKVENAITLEYQSAQQAIEEEKKKAELSRKTYEPSSINKGYVYVTYYDHFIGGVDDDYWEIIVETEDGLKIGRSGSPSCCDLPYYSDSEEAWWNSSTAWFTDQKQPIHVYISNLLTKKQNHYIIYPKTK